MTSSSVTENGGRLEGLQRVINCVVSRRTEKKKQRKRHKLAQLIKVINTLAILFIMIPELTKFRTIKNLGHLHIVRMSLIQSILAVVFRLFAVFLPIDLFIIRHSSSQPSLDPTSDVDIVAFSFAIYFRR